MFARAFFAFCLLAASASAELITITEGNFDRVNLDASRELLFTGGTIEYLNNVGGLATIDGGSLTGLGQNASRVTAGGTMIFRGTGTTQYQRLDSRLANDGASVNTIQLEGLEFRGRLEPGTVIIQGVLLDGSFLNMNLFHSGARSRHRFIVVDHPELFTDPTRDGMFDLADLNVVRNNFGQAGDLDAGDIDGDGLIGLGDLNEVRNRFGNLWEVGPEWRLSGDLLNGNAVPEPNTLILALAVAVLITALGRRLNR